jgi:CubicO group peptidase (beta-lactamase class C family)
MTGVIAFGGACALAAGLMLALPASAQDARIAQVDKIFAKWTKTTPGCAVGVAVDGRPMLQKAYGMADLEHDVPLAADSIIEAGSVSKQFTAAAVLLLARDGKLSLDDPVRKHVPELPDYKVPLTIRHMLTHTSGLRDWGSLYGIAGWPRTSRAYTHAHVLDLLSRQKALNFTPGTDRSYSNSGYNLAAIIVSRVSGMPFADFTRTRIFEPLGMTRTSWRDDYERIVPGRAIGYQEIKGTFRQDMPFENVHGNGGLLTTVGDLLKWNQNFVIPKIGDADFRREQLTPGKFTNGNEHNYSMGLYLMNYRGLNEISHSGATAGYRAYLAKYPDMVVDVAVLCNASNGDATGAAHAVADVYLAGRVKLLDPPPASKPKPAPPSTWKPSAADLKAFAGAYHSEEIETTLTIGVKDGALELRRRPDTVIALRPLSTDTFDGGGIGEVKFHRDSGGRVTALGIKQDRVWDLRFSRD